MKKWISFNPAGLAIFMLALIFAYPTSCRLYGFFSLPLSGKFLLLATIWAGFTAAIWLSDNRYGWLSRFAAIKRKTSILALLSALAALYLFHWQTPAFPSTFQVEVAAKGPVLLTGIMSGGKTFAPDHLTTRGDWELTDAGWASKNGSEVPLVFTGSAEAPLEFTFATGPDQGSVSLTMQGQATRIDLQTPMTDTAFAQPFLSVYGTPGKVWFLWIGLLFISEILLVSLLFFVLFSRWPYGSAAFLFPIIFLLPYVTTFAGHNVSLGNDFGPFYYVYKTYLLDFLADGTLPLWSPSEGAGYPFFSNPLAQALYPVNIALAQLYRINNGYTRLDHQIYTVAAICWFSLGLYAWLRSLRVENRHALIAATTMALSYKMTELIRFPNAAHEASWYPWILLALTGLFASRAWKSIWLWAAALCGSLICLFTAGYPYYIYYLPFLAGPYLLFMLFPRIRLVIFGVDKPDWRKFLGGFSAASAAALVMCGPYLYHMSRTIALTSGRAGDDYTHATMYPFDFLDTVESLVYPVAARPEGWFYFGAIALAVIVLYLSRPQKDGDSKEETLITARRSWQVKAALAGWFAFLSYLSYGEQSFLFLLFYRILPAFSALRGWGRLSIALLPGLALLFSFALSDLDSRLGKSGKINRLYPHTWIPLAGITVFSVGFQVFEFSRGITDEYWELYFIPRAAYLIQTIANVLNRDIVPDRTALSHLFSYSYIAFSLLAGLLFYILLSCRQPHSSNQRRWIFTGLGILSLINLWYGGPWLWNNGFTPREIREPGHYARQMPSALKNPRKNENSTLTLSPAFSVGSPPKWHFAAYQDFYFNPLNDTPARDELLGVADGRRFFFSSTIKQANLDTFLTDSRAHSIKPEVVEYNGDFLQVNVTAPAAGYLSFIDNLDDNWTVRVDGSSAELESLLGTFKSVHLEAGTHEVVMAYCPRLFEWANPACAD